MRERGQAALAMVLGVTTLLVTGGAILAATAIQHDPLVQNDVVAHYAYRALEAGSNAFLNNVNANPNLISCSSASAAGGSCDPTEYVSWKQIDNTSGSGVVPEWYLWQNPVFCFDTACSVHNGTGTLQYIKVTIWGAAGFPGHIDYQSSTQILDAENGFLQRVWWTNYEATDPNLTGNLPTACTHDWQNNHNGPSLTANACQRVYFKSGDQIYGPIFSNDTIHVTNDPTLGPVTTADDVTNPSSYCLFWDLSSGCVTGPNSGIVQQSGADAAKDAWNQPLQKLLQTDSSIEALAALKGCVYYGPTTITFDSGDTMTVWSQDTPTSPRCLPSQGATVNVPNGANGNGVVYVAACTASPTGTSVPGANPFDNYQSSTSSNGPNAQWGYDGNYFNYAGHSALGPDCEGDAFVSDNPTGGGVSGQLTIAADNDVVVTGNIQYTHCGPSFDSTVNNPCSFNPTSTNDALGLIANQYIEVNHPVVPSCITTRTRRGTTTTCSGVNRGSSLEPDCTSSVSGTPSAALCDPGPKVTIDAALLALNHSYLVNNEGLIDSNGTYGAGSTEGTLTVYGSIDQNWRGAVGVFGMSRFGGVPSGYTKDYDWDSRLQYVTPPYYLTPGTPSWGLASSATNLAPNLSTCNDGQSPPNPCPAA